MDMTRPCPKCPFRSDIPGYLRRSRVREIQHHLTRGDGRFTCHETTVPDDDSDSGEMYDGPNAKHCAGAMILLHKTGDYNQMMRIAARLLTTQPADPDNPLGLDLDAPVYESFADMIKAQPR